MTALISRLEEAGEGSRTSNARLAAELQAVALAIRIGGLEGLRSGAVTLTSVSALPNYQEKNNVG